MDVEEIKLEINNLSLEDIYEIRDFCDALAESIEKEEEEEIN